MALGEKIFEAFRSVLVLNERVERHGHALEKLVDDLRDMDRRLVRIETVLDLRGPARSKPDQM